MGGRLAVIHMDSSSVGSHDSSKESTVDCVRSHFLAEAVRIFLFATISRLTLETAILHLYSGH
jgi:hypothetical protein